MDLFPGVIPGYTLFIPKVFYIRLEIIEAFLNGQQSHFKKVAWH